MQETGFNPWIGKIPWRRVWQPIPVFLPGESHGQKGLVGFSPQGLRVRHDWSALACVHTSTNYKGEENNSTLENPGRFREGCSNFISIESFTECITARITVLKGEKKPWEFLMLSILFSYGQVDTWLRYKVQNSGRPHSQRHPTLTQPWEWPRI